MATQVSHSNLETPLSTLKIGRVFTPEQWALWCINRFNIYDQWRDGATIIDPTCGHGSFFHSLFTIAYQRHEAILPRDLDRLIGIEIVEEDKFAFINQAQQRFGLHFPEDNFITTDFMSYHNDEKFDIAVGNPPWINYSDLPDSYKAKAGDYFLKHGLVKSRRDVLLGSSRADMASVIIQKCMAEHIRDRGHGYFFVPASLFFNEDANKHFRPRVDHQNIFRIDELYSFDIGQVFEGVKVKSCLVAIEKEPKQTFPIRMHNIGTSEHGSTSFCHSTPDNGAWIQTANPDMELTFGRIEVASHQMPRQGINTCGLNKVFIFDRQDQDEGRVEERGIFTNGYGQSFELSSRYMFPLIDRNNFDSRSIKRSRYILCLHGKTGIPLSFSSFSDLFGISEYVAKYADEMKKRKGVLIQNKIQLGDYWALMGVGPYSFSPYKVVWESLGKRSFRSIVVDGSWQGNQAMHAYIPAYDYSDATRISSELNAIVPTYLQLFGMEGTCNWAQPGRIKRLLSLSSDQAQLF